MSMNINMAANREITVNKTGKQATQTQYLKVWQTPTKVSYEIKSSENPIEAYFAWVLSISEDVEENVYGSGDIFQEGPVVGTKIYNSGKEHVTELQEEIKQLLEEGYEIEVEVW